MSYSITGPQGPMGLPGLSAHDIMPSVFKFKEEHMFAGIDIRITPAHGGTIVSISRGSGSTPSLYVVAEDQDLGTEIGKIITMTCLTKET